MPVGRLVSFLVVQCREEKEMQVTGLELGQWSLNWAMLVVEVLVVVAT